MEEQCVGVFRQERYRRCCDERIAAVARGGKGVGDRHQLVGGVLDAVTKVFLCDDGADARPAATVVRREGVYAGAYSFVEKASMAFGPLLIGLILQAVLFRPSVGRDVAQPPEALTGILIGAAVVPAVLYAVSIVPLLYFRLDPAPATTADTTVPAK